MPEKKTLLFSLQRKNSSTRHFLFGTMHTRNEGAYTHSKLALKYIDEANFYFAEMDLSDSGLINMPDHFMLPESMTLRALYSERHFLRMQKILRKSFNLDIRQFERFSPFYIQTIIGELVLKADNRLPLDFYLWEEAMKAGKKMSGVESLEQQIEILQQIPIHTQARSLKLLSENTAKFRNTINRLTKAYEKADIVSLYKITKKQLGTLRNLMLTGRNIRMTRFIIDHITEESSFFSVGAAHLAGRTGIIYLLKQSGFVVKPVKH